MTRLEDDLRSALRATASQIPPGPPPPLTRPDRRRQSRPAGRPGRARWTLSPGWRRWAVALAALVLIGAVISGLQALMPPARGRSGPVPAPPQPASPTTVPAYYVALSSASTLPGAVPQATTATIRASATGDVLDVITVPPPYQVFTGVTAAADDRTFVLVAQKNEPAGGNGTPAARFYVLHFDPAGPAADRIRLQALPASDIPAGSQVQAMALSGNGTSLAASIGPAGQSRLYVYHLATGNRRVWSWSPCTRGCTPYGIGDPDYLLTPGQLSWAADGRTLAFVFRGGSASQRGVRLLDTNAPGAGLLADSKLAVAAPGPNMPYWRRAAITPDGRTILAVRAYTGRNIGGQQLVTASVATGKVTAILNQVPIQIGYEQIQWTSSSGSELVVSGAEPGDGAGVVRNGHYTPIPWSAQIFAAAW